MADVLEFEVRRVTTGTDRDGSPMVDITLRTENLQAMVLAGYIGKKTVKVKVLNDDA